MQNRRTSKTFSRTNEEESCEYTTDAHTLALYHFNETTGQVKDSSGNNNHGTAPNKINRKAEGLWETKAVEFHADPIKVRKSQSLNNLDDELTLEAWVYLQSPECENHNHHKTCWQKHFQHKPHCPWFSKHHCRKHLKCDCEEKCHCKPKKHWHCPQCHKKHRPKGSLIQREGSYELALKDGKATFTLFTQTPKNPGKRKCAPARTNKVTIKSSAIPLSQWVHIAAVYDGTKAMLYIDSTRQPEEKAISGDIKSTSTPLHLGGEGFKGTLEEVRISSIARSSFGATVTHTETIARLFYYNGWQTIEEHERTATQGQPFGPQTPYRRFTDGPNIDEHLCVEYYKDGSSTQIERICYFHQNHRGDIVAITDESANILLRLEYTAYGEVYKIGADGGLEALSTEEKELIVYTFQGRQLDPETGLHYFRNRYYSAQQGRFLQRDPLGYVDGLGLHEAFGGSPGNFIDPLGNYIDISDLANTTEDFINFTEYQGSAKHARYIYTRKGGWLDRAHIWEGYRLFQEIYKQLKTKSGLKLNLDNNNSALKLVNITYPTVYLHYLTGCQTYSVWGNAEDINSTEFLVSASRLIAFEFMGSLESIQGVAEEFGIKAGSFTIEDQPSVWIGTYIAEMVELQGKSFQDAFAEIMNELCPVSKKESLEIYKNYKNLIDTSKVYNQHPILFDSSIPHEYFNTKPKKEAVFHPFKVYAYPFGSGTGSESPWMPQYK